MKTIIKSNEISKIAKILASNNFVNVKDVNKLSRYLHVAMSNYYIFSIQKNFAAFLNYNKDFKNATNFFNVLTSDYNFLFNETIELKKENIEITIVEAGENE